MWLIARRSFAEEWVRLTATLVAVLLSVGLMAGALQFALQAQSAVSGSDASEYGRTDVIVQARGGDPDDPFAAPGGHVSLGRVRDVPGVAAVAGDAVVPVTVTGADGRPVNPPAAAATALRPWISDGRLNPYHLVSGRAPAAPAEVAVIRHVSRSGRLHPGSETSLLLPQETRRVKIVGVVTVDGRSAVASGDVVLAQPIVVQRAAGLPDGTWHRIWVKGGMPPARLAADLKRRLGASVTVREAAAVRNAQTGEMAAAGASVGGAIGMMASVAVFVGLFVVANTFGTLVRQRTRRLALLSAIGARPRQIKRLIRFEALVLAVVASGGGLLAGYGVADVLTRLFARDGFDISAADVDVGWISLAFPFAAGIVTTQLAAWRAARVAPVEALRSSVTDTAGRRWPRLAGALATFAAAWIFFGPAFVIAGEPPGPDRTIGITVLILMGTMVSMAGLAVLAPFLVGPLGGLVGRLGMLVSGEVGRLARATITRSPRRVSSAASSLMLGVALVAATGLMMTSVNDRFDVAGTATMRADHAIAAEGKSMNGAVPLPGDVTGRVARVPGVTHAVALTTASSKIVAPRPKVSEDVLTESIEVTGADPAGLPAVLRLPGRVPALRAGQIAISSYIAKAYGLRIGETMTMRGSAGRVTLTVAGIYHDPSHLFADQALAEPSTLARLNTGVATQVVLVRGSASARALSQAVAGVAVAKVYDRGGYVAHAAARMQTGVQVIYGFLGMALVIALFGMATTISLSVSERTKEFGLLGAVGTTTRQIRSIVRWEAATVVLLGVLLGMGAAIGTMTLAHAATGSSFIRAGLPLWLLALVVAGAAIVTLATSAMPARRAARMPVLEATKAN